MVRGIFHYLVPLLVSLELGCGVQSEDDDRPNVVFPSGGSSSTGGSHAGPDQAGAAQAGSAQAGEASTAPECDKPFQPPSGGPRQDGPPGTTEPCASIPDVVILERYRDPSARVPRGLYYEPQHLGVIEKWVEGCAPSLADTLVRARAELGPLAGGSTTEWFNEAIPCSDSYWPFRQLRCDYFDDRDLRQGKRFANPDAGPEELAFLGSLRWWSDNRAIADATLLGYNVQVQGTTQVVELCELSTTRGSDLIVNGVLTRICDSVDVFRTQHAMKADGAIVLGTAERVRTIEGRCD